jgi:parallel beta-helix repeat protein
MKRIFCIASLVIVITCTYVFADDVEIAPSGNLTTGVDSSGNLEVTGASAEFAIVGKASGTGGVGVYGEHFTSVNDYSFGMLGDYNYGVYGYSVLGYAGYFIGPVLISGNLTVQSNTINDSPIGDIVQVTAGTGLTGGATEGNATLDVDFGGTGTATTVSRTDHQHAGSDITSGSVAAANIDTTIARDSEIMTTVLANDGEGTTLDADLLDGKEGSYYIDEIMPKVLANDGAGSTLDADLLDGQHSSEIIAAASDEVRTEISACGTTIDASGSFYVSSNLTATGHCIEVTVDNVTIDLMGFTLTGDGNTGDYGVYINEPSNVEVKNGTITNFGIGVYSKNTSNTESSNRVINIRAFANTVYGIFLNSYDNLVKGCTASGNTYTGIYAGIGSTVTNNTAYDNQDNSSYGIKVLSGSTVTNNTVTGNHGNYGIYAEWGSTITNNTVTGHQGSISGIFGNSGSTVTNNTVYNCEHWGIKVNQSSKVTGNTIYNNNRSDTSGEGGLGVTNNVYVKGNALDNNNRNNLYVDSYDNMIEENLVTRSTNGIYFNSSGNFYANNRASGNTTNYAGTLPTGSGDGGGNVGF